MRDNEARATSHRTKRRDTAMAVLPREEIALGHDVTPEEGRQILDRAARRRLGISGEEFLRRWDAGEYVEVADEPNLARVAILIPFGR